MTIPLMVAGTLFLWAAFTPFGWPRRVMIGLGAAIPAGLATILIAYARTDGWEDGMSWVVAIPSACAVAAGSFYLSVRIAH